MISGVNNNGRMHMPTTWVVVAESSSARILTTHSRIGPFIEHDTLLRPEARLKERDLTSDLPGRSFDSAGAGRHALETAIRPRQQQTLEFADHVAEYLNKAYIRHEYGQLIIIAAPAFLGLLRKQLSNQAVSSIVLELDKNLGHHTSEEIRRYLPDFLPVKV